MKLSDYLEKMLNASLWIRKVVAANISNLLMISGVLLIFAAIYDIGFIQSEKENSFLITLYHHSLWVWTILFVLRNILNLLNPLKKRKTKFIDFGVLLLLYFLRGYCYPEHLSWLPGEAKYILVPVYFIITLMEISRNAVHISTRKVNPAMVFVLSFLLLILGGTGLLLLPQATTNGISLMDALFTATSAVCVTGLIVVDTATAFTKIGQSIIILLIQAGGLGIMTFAGFLGHIFSGGSSFQNQLMVKDFISNENMNNVMKSLYKIIFITLLVEGIGAAWIFFSLPENLFTDFGEKIYFSIFHAISAFCNAGFSTFTDNLYDIRLRFNYNMHMAVAILLIFGGLGFPIVFNFYHFIKHWLKNIFLRIFAKRRFVHLPHLMNINSKIILLTTAVLLFLGTVLYYIFEYNTTLADHHGIGKWVTAFFGATTPRTAGFNTVDMTLFTFPTIMIYLLLMWIGASPGGTGGGIKTTTFAVATMNIWSLVRGKENVVIFKRDILSESMRKAFAIISLSLIVLGFSTFLIYSFDGHHSLVHIAFETFSAYSTVGLTLGITPTLSEPSKLVLIITMFIGRVGMLTFLMAFFYKNTMDRYRYPSGEIMY